jgi:hypothetical protein
MAVNCLLEPGGSWYNFGLSAGKLRNPGSTPSAVAGKSAVTPVYGIEVGSIPPGDASDGVPDSTDSDTVGACVVPGAAEVTAVSVDVLGV